MLAFLRGWIDRSRAARVPASVTRVRAIRGATGVEFDTRPDVRCAVAGLIAAIEARNGITADDVISAVFTTTPDITSMFPAMAARDSGWSSVPQLCATEINVPGSLPRCIRVLVHVELRADHVVQHVYLGSAAALRPDLATAAHPRSSPP